MVDTVHSGGKIQLATKLGNGSKIRETIFLIDQVDGKVLSL